MGAPGTGLKYIGGKNRTYVSNKGKHFSTTPKPCPLCYTPMMAFGKSWLCPNEITHELNRSKSNG